MSHCSIQLEEINLFKMAHTTNLVHTQFWQSKAIPNSYALICCSVFIHKLPAAKAIMTTLNFSYTLVSFFIFLFHRSTGTICLTEALKNKDSTNLRVLKDLWIQPGSLFVSQTSSFFVLTWRDPSFTGLGFFAGPVHSAGFGLPPASIGLHCQP